MMSCAWYEGAALGRVVPQCKCKGDEDGFLFAERGRKILRTGPIGSCP